MDYAKIMKFLTSKGEEQEKALDELNQKEVEFVLDRARAAAKRQRMGVLAMIDKESETIEYLVSILLTFTSDQMAAFVAGAQEIIAQYTPKN